MSQHAGPLETNRRELLLTGARGAGVVLSAGAFATLLQACGSSGDDAGTTGAPSGLTAADIAKATGTVSVLGWDWYQVPEFNKQGVRGKWAALTKNEDTITKSAQSGAFDLTTILTFYQPQLRKADRLQPIDPTLLKNFDAIDPVFRESAVEADGTTWGVPLQWGYGYLEYNADEIEEPTSLDDLMSPKLRKKVGIPDDPTGVIVTFAILTGKPNPTRLTQAEFDDVMSTLDAFRPQILTLHAFGEEPPILARGDMLVDFPAYGPSFLTAREGGADIQITLLGAWSYVDCMSLYKDAENPAAAYKYIDNTLTVSAQRACSKHGAAFPVLKAATSAVPEELRYADAAEVIEQAPIVPGAPAEAGDDGIVPYSEWIAAWEDFKQGV